MSNDTDLMPESEASRFRWELGFASDAETVTRSYDDRIEFPSVDFGLPLSKVEYDEVLRRAGVQHALAPALDVASREATFGGAYVDQRAGGVPVFAFTDDPAVYGKDIAAALPTNVDFRLEHVNHSFAQLREKQARISERWKELRAEGVHVTSTGLRDDLNLLEVGVTNLNEEAAWRIEREFGPGLLIREEGQAIADACNSVHDCRPIKGGLEIRSQWNNGECTSGFIV